MSDDMTSPIGLGSLFGSEDGGEVQKVVVTSYSDAASSNKEKEKEKTQEERYQDAVKRYGRQPSGFIGLENQGSTCYLNSIVQCLYMTPEIRSTMFKLSKEDLNLDAPPEDFDKKKDEKKTESKPEEKISVEYFVEMGFKKKYIEKAFKKHGQKPSDHDTILNELLNDANSGASDEDKKNDLAEIKKEEQEKLEAEHKKIEDEQKRLAEKKKPKKPKIIPIHIQKLFSQLNLANKPYVSTEELTKAFGWKSSHVYFEQHDVQELTRVLFEVLRDQLKKTEHKDLMNLFKGQTAGKIICQKCGTVSERVEDFVDLTLIIKGINFVTKNVPEGLAKLLETENLTGENQYSCDKCKCKTDAKKGLCIRNLPPLLIFSLNRFEYDWSRGGERKKINQKYDYPESINMKEYLEDNDTNKALTEDESTYELFAVIIHVGAQNKGHYHCYIRDLLNEGRCTVGQFSNKSIEDPKRAVWYDFNDKYVSPLSYDDVKKQSGDEKSDESAYMLLYRRKDMSKYQPLCDALYAIPPHLEAEIKEINEKAEKDRKDAEFEETIYRMNVYIPEFFLAHGSYLYAGNYDFHNKGGNTYKEIVASKSTLVKDFKQQIIDAFGEDKVPKGFTMYYLEKNIMMMSADRHRIVAALNEDDEKILLKTRYLQSRIHILAATPETLGKVAMAKGGEMEIRLYKYVSAKEPNSNTVGFPPTATFKSFCGALETYCKIKQENLILYCLRFRAEPKLVQVENPLLPLFAIDGLDGSIAVEDKTAQGNQQVHFCLQQYAQEHNEITLFMTDKVTNRQDSKRTDNWNPEFTYKAGKDWNLKNLKQKLLDLLLEYHSLDKPVDPSTCVLRRANHYGPQDIIENEDQRCDQAKVENYDRLIIESKYEDAIFEVTFVEIPESSRDVGEKWKMQVDTRWTIKQVKEKLIKLSPKKFISLHDFRLREDSHWHNIAGNIISDEDAPLSKITLRKGDLIYCELGAPPIKEMIGIKIYAIKWPPKDLSKYPGDHRAASFERYARMSEYSTFKQLKKKIMKYEEFKCKSTEYCRVRYCIKDPQGYYRAGDVINHNSYYRSLKKLNFVDDIIVMVQLLNEPDKEQAEEQDEVKEEEDEKKRHVAPVYLTIRKRLPKQKMFDKGTEIAFYESDLENLDTFKALVGKHYSEVATDKMIISKFSFEDKKWKNFFGEEDEETKKKSFRSKYALKDGDVICFKNLEEDLNNEDPFYEFVVVPEERETSYYSTSSWTRPKSPEKQLKIEYDKDED